MKRYGAPHMSTDINRFIHFWVAIDVLVPLGTGSDPFGDFKSRARKYLHMRYGTVKRKKVDAVLESPLYLIRKAVFHQGDRAAISGEDNERVRLLVRDLLFKELALPDLDPLPTTFF